MGIREELVEMIAHDDAVRDRLARDGSLFEGYNAEMEAVHRTNAVRLAAIVDAHGWPGRALVGDEAASAAWRVVQHAIGEPAFMRRMLPLVRAAAERGDASTREAAMLEDRIRTFEGRPQMYGTQYDWNDDGTAMVPSGSVEDPDGIDTRRRAVGLPPMQWRLRPPPHEPPPSDIAARRAESEAWARRVGWR